MAQTLCKVQIAGQRRLLHWALVGPQEERTCWPWQSGHFICFTLAFLHGTSGTRRCAGMLCVPTQKGPRPGCPSKPTTCPCPCNDTGVAKVPRLLNPSSPQSLLWNGRARGGERPKMRQP